MGGRAFGIIFSVAVVLGILGQDLRGASSEGKLLLPMLEILGNAKLSGSLEFTGRCDGGFLPTLPPLRMSAEGGGSTLQALREIFRDDHAIGVQRDPGGKIRMVESAIPTDLLNIKIRHITFDGIYASGPENGVYTPNQALHVILQAPELTTFIKAHDIEVLSTDYGISGGGSRNRPDSPHISGSLDDVTLSQALDRVLDTFPGIWVYENCSAEDHRERAVYFRFFYLRDIGTGLFVEG
jgi:hypothetical protein